MSSRASGRSRIEAEDDGHAPTRLREAPGLGLRWREYGSPGAPPLVLLHGFAGNQTTWSEWVGALARDHHVLTVDFRGFGEADKSRGADYSPSAHAKEVQTLLEYRQLDRVAVVGHSLGGGVALLLALRDIDTDRPRLGRLAIIGAPSFPQPIPPFISAARRAGIGATLLRLIPPRVVIREALRSIVFDPDSVTEDQISRYAAPLRRRGGRRGLLLAARQLVPTDLDALVARYPEITLPTLLLWGRHDRVVPVAYAERLARTLPNARLRVFEQCGHLLPEERPVEGLAAVRRFLDETAGTG